MSFLQEIDFAVEIRKGKENQVVDYLYRLYDKALLDCSDRAEIDDFFQDEHALAAS